MWHSNENIRGKRGHPRKFPAFEIVLQPIVDLDNESVFAYEALCRGMRGEMYPELIGGMEPEMQRSFDRLALVKALQLAAELRVQDTGSKISLNTGPVTGPDASYVQAVARHYGISVRSIVVELTEGVRMSYSDLSRTIDRHRLAGIMVAIDDFGAGYAGLNWLAACTPDLVKLDRDLIRGIEFNKTKKTIVEGFAAVCKRLAVRIVAEGVETLAECRTLQRFGISLMQGHLFARPAACMMPVVCFPGRYMRLPPVSREDRMWLRRALRQ